jgi:hypothetical protein
MNYFDLSPDIGKNAVENGIGSMFRFLTLITAGTRLIVSKWNEKTGMKHPRFLLAAIGSGLVTPVRDLVRVFSIKVIMEKSCYTMTNTGK